MTFLAINIFSCFASERSAACGGFLCGCKHAATIDSIAADGILVGESRIFASARQKRGGALVSFPAASLVCAQDEDADKVPFRDVRLGRRCERGAESRVAFDYYDRDRGKTWVGLPFA
jgi:hypothetical protein